MSPNPYPASPRAEETALLVSFATSTLWAYQDWGYATIRKLHTLPRHHTDM